MPFMFSNPIKMLQPSIRNNYSKIMSALLFVVQS